MFPSTSSRETSGHQDGKTKEKSSFVLRFTDEISDLKEKRPHQESHTSVGRFIVQL